MEDVIYYNDLYDLYGKLLTEKQCKYFEDYYFHNLSFSEMADNYDISRNAVFKQVHSVINKLEEYEKKLQLLSKRKKLYEISNSVLDLELRKKIQGII